MSYQKAKDSIQKAHELKHDNTRFYREFQDKVRTEINAIAGDSDLSADGRYNRTTAAKKKHGTDLMKQAHVRRLQYLAHLKDAKTHAEAEIYAKIKKPDATTLERFEASLRKVKTELLLSMNAKTAAAKLTEFITQVSDPYCASILHEQFADLAGPIIAQTPPSENAKPAMNWRRHSRGWRPSLNPQTYDQRGIHSNPLTKWKRRNSSLTL